MSPVGIAVAALFVPFLAAGAVFAVARWLLQRLGVADGDRAAVALALGAGYVASHTAIAVPAFPPIDVTDRIPWLVAIATALGFLESIRPSPAWARWENRLLMTALVLGAMLGPLLGEASEAGLGPAWVAGLGVALLASWVNLEALAARLAGVPLALSLLIIMAAAGVTVLVSGSLVMGQLGFALASALAAVVLLSARGAGVTLDRGGVPILAVSVGALLLDGHFYAGLPGSSALILIAAPVVSWLCWFGPIRQRPTWQVALLAAVVTLIPVSLALGIALAASP